MNYAYFKAIKGNIGDNVRIDDFVIIKGKINISSNVHISSFCSLSAIGAERSSEVTQ